MLYNNFKNKPALAYALYLFFVILNTLFGGYKLLLGIEVSEPLKITFYGLKDICFYCTIICYALFIKRSLEKLAEKNFIAHLNFVIGLNTTAILLQFILLYFNILLKDVGQIIFIVALFYYVYVAYRLYQQKHLIAQNFIIATVVLAVSSLFSIVLSNYYSAFPYAGIGTIFTQIAVLIDMYFCNKILTLSITSKKHAPLDI